MKKRIFALCIAVLTAVMSFGVLAKEKYCRLQDTSELLTEAENAEILAKLNELSEKYDVDVIIRTVDSLEDGVTAEDAATEWYDASGFNEDGVMLYISMETRDMYILTSGFCIEITDADIDDVSEKIVYDISDENYAKAFDTFVTEFDGLINTAKNGAPYNLGMSLVVSVAIGFIVSLIITGRWKGQLKSVALQTRAASYMKPESLNISDSRDFFLYRTVDRREKPKESSSNSSTHQSSSGKTYGGKGRKF